MPVEKNLSGMDIVVIGACGFVGRHLVEKLAQKGARITVILRKPSKISLLKPYGIPGQIMPLIGDLQNTESLLPALKQADAVVNLVGILFPTRKASFDEIHHRALENLGQQARRHNVKKIIHISAIGSDTNSLSDYAKSKGLGEKALLKAFANSFILRPTIIFGSGDGFFTRFARMARISPFLPLIGGGHTRFQPVYVGDVVKAICSLLESKDISQRIYDLGGPEIFTFRQCLEIMQEETGTRRLFLPIPFFVASLIGRVASLLPTPPLTRDQVSLLRYDNIVSQKYPGFEALGIKPISLAAILPTYMDAFRNGGRFS